MGTRKPNFGHFLLNDTMSNPTLKHPSEYGCLQMIGFVFFMWPVVAVLLHLEFNLDDSMEPAEPFLPDRLGLLVAINLACGALGGLMVHPSQKLKSIVLGIINAGVLTVVTYIYFYWREDFFYFEIAVPPMVGIVVGILSVRLWNRF